MEAREDMREKSRGVDGRLADTRKFCAKIGEAGMQDRADVLLEAGKFAEGHAVNQHRADFNGLALGARDAAIFSASGLEIEKNIVAVAFPVLPFQRKAFTPTAANMSSQFRSIFYLVLTLASTTLFAQTPPENKPAPVSPELNPKSDAETKRLADEAEAKRLKDEEERRVAEKKAADEAARLKAEAEKSAFTKLIENSKLYTGVGGGMGIGLNSLHGTGYTLGMTIDYLAYKTYGFHFGAGTGEFPAKNGTLSAGGSTVNVYTGGYFGVLNFDFAAVYAFPVFLNLEPAVGAGVSLYQLRGGTYNFNQRIAPLIYASAYYNVFSHLQVGLITQLTIATASTIQSTGTEVALDSSVGLTTLSLQLSVRYAWF